MKILKFHKYKFGECRCNYDKYYSNIRLIKNLPGDLVSKSTFICLDNGNRALTKLVEKVYYEAY